ncbi:hypothetical protein [Caenispirillum bisanense]|uniref:hypothetical protein n=1 Tax=Caenispirillum bisanense TaxID=414052 RepID=UPI0031DF8B98
MTPQQIGLVYNELRQNRILYGQAVPGRRRSESEREAIRILTAAGGRLGDLEDFLETQGLRLVVRDIQQFGLAGDGLAYAAIRNPATAPPAHLRGGEILRAVTDSRRDETPEQVAIRATFFMLILLYFLYTRDERPIEAVSSFKDSSVDEEEFLSEARRRIDALNAERDDGSDSRRTAIRSAIVGLTDRQLDKRVEAFLGAMKRVGILEEIKDVSVSVGGLPHVAYRQTLWSALEIAENFRRYAPHLLVEDTIEQVEAIGGASEAPEDRQFAREENDQPRDAGDLAEDEVEEVE